MSKFKIEEVKVLDIMITTLESNLKIIKLIKDNLNNEEQEKAIYPIMYELKQVCDVCINSYAEQNKLS